MDPFDNPQTFKRSIDNPSEPADETETCTAQQSGKPSVDADPAPIEDARREKIESLRKAVADGTYNVSADEVARKLIEHMLEPKG